MYMVNISMGQLSYETVINNFSMVETSFMLSIVCDPFIIGEHIHGTLSSFSNVTNTPGAMFPREADKWGR